MFRTPQEYVDAGLVGEQMAQVMHKAIEMQRFGETVVNEHDLGLDAGVKEAKLGMTTDARSRS